ncbi:MAG: pilus assembly protein TadG-related protein [Candidatus Dormibacteraeota bacterium]|nr:pilus assembly protein TadG-related protein [Candidatus Dormibacteraeota bacterium]
MNRRSRQRGQSLVLAALLITALTGFVGLAVDGGEAANEQQIVRSAADGAALAGAYSIGKGSTIANATILSGQVLAAVPLPASDLTMTYLDSAGTVTAVPASVAKVRAVVIDNHTTYFLTALGVPTLRLTATAEANVPGPSGGTVAPCALCIMGPSGSTINESTSSSVIVTGGIFVANSDTQTFNNNSSLSDSATPTSLIYFGGNNNNSGSGVTITPAPIVRAGIADPLSAIPVPVVAGAAAASYTAPAGASNLTPGVYSTVTVPATATLTLLPGTFVFTTLLNITGGTVIGSGVTLFFACAAYQTACGNGASGGHLTMSLGSLTLSPPTSGTYFGLTVFADRKNVAGNTFSQGTVNVTGTWYTLLEAVSDTHTGDSPNFGQMAIASLTIANNDVVHVSESSTTSYGTGTSTIGLTL